MWAVLVVWQDRHKTMENMQLSAQVQQLSDKKGINKMATRHTKKNENKKETK